MSSSSSSSSIGSLLEELQPAMRAPENVRAASKASLRFLNRGVSHRLTPVVVRPVSRNILSLPEFFHAWRAAAIGQRSRSGGIKICDHGLKRCNAAIGYGCRIASVTSGNKKSALAANAKSLKFTADVLQPVKSPGVSQRQAPAARRKHADGAPKAREAWRMRLRCRQSLEQVTCQLAFLMSYCMRVTLTPR
jgi:hypothetical protein